jgi:hypothetical protein
MGKVYYGLSLKSKSLVKGIKGDLVAKPEHGSIYLFREPGDPSLRSG